MKKLKHWLWQFARAHGPCRSNLTAWFPNFNSVDDRIVDKVATGTHEADKAVSLKFSGAQNVEVDLTGYEYLGEECHRISFKFYNSAVINKATAAQQPINIDASASANGILFGSWTGNIVDEIISVPTGTGSANISAWRSSSENIPIGEHTIVIQWNGSGYDIYLDNVQKNNIVVGTVELLVLSRLIIGSTVSPSAYLNNTNLYDVEIQREDGTIIFANSISQKSGIGWIESEIGPAAQLTNFTLPDDFTESVEYGHSWNTSGYSEYILADGITSGGHNVVGKIPEDPDNLGYDVVGNALNRPGTARQNLIDNGDNTYSPVSSLELFSADVGTNFLFDVSGNPQTFTIADMEAWTNYRLDDKFFYNENKAAFYSAAPSLVCLRQTENYIK